MGDGMSSNPKEVPPRVRLRVNNAARECWLALRELSDYYLSDGIELTPEDLDLFTAATRHPGVQERLRPARR